MGDAFKKVQSGQPLAIPAETFNAFLDAARDFRARQQSRTREPQPLFRQSGIVKVKNASGADRSRFEILGIDRPIFTPSDNLDSFQNDVLLVGVAPDPEDHAGQFCILLEPLRADAIGLAVVSGVCPVRIDVQAESDPYAEVQDDPSQLKSGGSGSAKILWKEDGTGEDKWAVVRLANGDARFKLEVKEEPLEEGSSAECYLLERVDGGWQRKSPEEIVSVDATGGFAGVALKGDYVDAVKIGDGYYAGGIGHVYLKCTAEADGAQGESSSATIDGYDDLSLTVGTCLTDFATDDELACWWHRGQREWQCGRLGGLPEIGCGLEVPESGPDEGKLKVKNSELAGVGLKAGEGCSLDADLVGGCGIDVHQNMIGVDLTEIVEPGFGLKLVDNPPPACDQLKFEVDDCYLLEGDDGKLAINLGAMVGPGLRVEEEGDCQYLAAKVGCGLHIVEEGIEVTNTDLAGAGLIAGEGCRLNVDCAWIEANCGGGEPGPQGPQGLPGAPGSQGPQGAQGESGPCPTISASATCVGSGGTCGVNVTQTGCDASFSFTLAQGEQGPQGQQGAQGSQGAQGASGDPGWVGAQGPQGVQGSQGSPGIDGAQGPQGQQGPCPVLDAAVSSVTTLPGGSTPTALVDVTNLGSCFYDFTFQFGLPQGPQGAQGEPGPQGMTGSQGPQGATGAPGAQGAQGAAGDIGPQGSQGSQGVQGSQGLTGSQGPTGDIGQQGTQGSPGAQGPQGMTGAQGPQGDMGPQGWQGAPGDKLAIVPFEDRYVGLFCVESPDVRFEDVVRLPITGPVTSVPLDAKFLAVCEPGSVEVAGVASPVPTLVGAVVDGERLIVRTTERVPFVTVTLSGIRRGRGGVRFPPKTRDEMVRNNSFWDQARC